MKSLRIIAWRMKVILYVPTTLLIWYTHFWPYHRSWWGLWDTRLGLLNTAIGRFPSSITQRCDGLLFFQALRNLNGHALLTTIIIPLIFYTVRIKIDHLGLEGWVSVANFHLTFIPVIASWSIREVCLAHAAYSVPDLSKLCLLSNCFLLWAPVLIILLFSDMFSSFL